MPAQPQDHKPAKGEPFTFTGKDGETYTLPSADKGRSKVSGRDLRDATVGGDAAMMGFMFKVLEAAGPTEAALDALYDMPAAETSDVLKAWGQYGDGDGASLGE